MVHAAGSISFFRSSFFLSFWPLVVKAKVQIGNYIQRGRGPRLGRAGEEGGLIWVQDFSLEGKSMDEVRSGLSLRRRIQLTVQGLAGGSFTIQPCDTWQGVYWDELNIDCGTGQACSIVLPDFTSDMAFKIIRQ